MIYTIEALKEETRLKIFGAIGQTMDGQGFMLADFLQATEGLTRGTLVIEMNSPGGNPNEAFAIHDAIKQLPVKVVGRIMGTAASACTIIAAACDEREIMENGSYLVHNASTFAAGKKEELGKEFDELEKIDNRMLNIYVKQTGKSRKALQELMKQDRTMTPEEALNWGFVNKIIYNENKKLAAMAEEKEKKEEASGDLDSLRSENKALKSKIETLMAKLKSYEEEKEKDKDAKIKALVTEAIKAGKIKAEAAEHFVSFGKHDFEAMTATIDGIQVKYEPIEVPKPTVSAMTKEAAWEAFKKGDIKTHAEYIETIKNMEG
jgi:ATP-dependent Clp protease protease subunit